MNITIVSTKRERQHEERLKTAKPNSIAVKKPELLKEWDWEKNEEDGLDPYQMTCGTGRKANWICSVCGYRWPAAVSSRAKGHGCSKCGAKRISAYRSKPKPGMSIGEVVPELVFEWDYEKNDKSPYDVPYKSNRKVAWICLSCGYRWSAVVASRANGHGCPDCGHAYIGRMRAKPEHGKSLGDLYPEISMDWDATKNEMTPYDVRPGSHKIVAWKCSKCGYEWECSVKHRTSGTMCPDCQRGRTVSFPEKALFFYVKKACPDAVANVSPNIEHLGDMEFDIWIPSLSIAIEYDGEYWHQDGRQSRDAKKDFACFSNSIKLIRVREPRCGEYLHTVGTVVITRKSSTGSPSLNSAISEVLAVINQSLPIDVDVDRDYMDIRSLMDHIDENNLVSNFKELADSWHPTLNEGLYPSQFTISDKVEVWWVCQYGHSYKKRIDLRYHGSRCPECVTLERVERQTRPEPGKSLADLYPNTASEWVRPDDGVRNDISPDTVKPYSNYVVIWKCTYCGKTWPAQVNSRTCHCDKLGCRSCRAMIRIHGDSWRPQDATQHEDNKLATPLEDTSQ